MITVLKVMDIWRLPILVFCCFGGSLLVHPLAAAQVTGHPPLCTILDVSYPRYLVSGRSPIALSVEVVGAKEILGAETAKRLEYEWIVSAGEIMRGQGTPSILVSPGHLQANVVFEILAIVKLKGGSPACETEKSVTIKVDANCTEPSKFGEYGDLSFSNEKAYLDKLALTLAGIQPAPLVYILAYGGRHSCLWEARLRAQRAKRYLTEAQGIQGDRIVAAEHGFRENLTVEVFVAPSGSCGPLPTPSLAASEWRLPGSCEDKYRKRSETIYP